MNGLFISITKKTQSQSQMQSGRLEAYFVEMTLL